MNRMVDEQRTQIGIFKALGYSTRAIMGKYIFYAGSAALTGSIFGYFFGIDGAGYSFYEEHWIPLYKARGLQWHKTEGEE